MIAPLPEPGEEPSPEARPGMFLLGALLVPPFYLLLGWVVIRTMGEEPLLPAEHRLLLFGVLCALALAGCLGSFRTCNMLTGRRIRWLNNETVGGVLTIAMVEAPAFFGLIYHILYRHHVGFYLLVALSAGTFLAHGLSRKRD